MNILVAGMGLIGGSICKALKKYTSHNVIGYDINEKIVSLALIENTIDSAFDNNFIDIDLIILCMLPNTIESYFNDIAPKIKQKTLVTDVCGIKGDFSKRMKAIADNFNINYVGIHPMAGKEVGGYSNSSSELYIGANIVITPFENSLKSNVDLLVEFSESIGFKKIVITSPEEHDAMIAYTSQLAHIVSSAYVKSPSLDKECGFSGGSFQDMTRIATMNEDMWTPLFMQNKNNLSIELELLIKNLMDYKTALDTNNAEKLKTLIRDGKELKLNNLKKRIGQLN